MRRFFAIIAACLGAWTVTGQTITPPRLSEPSSAEMMRDDRTGVLDRVVRQFRFEDREVAPVDLPAFFHRVGPAFSMESERDATISARPGFPLFGRMSLSDDRPYEGRWCFQFQLDGGSMAARVPPKVIPVLPGADYEVSVMVRTDGLEHARARLVAMLYDQQGTLIPGTTVRSTLLRTDGEWERVSVRLPADRSITADLVIELQVLQPEQFTPAEPGKPRLRDVRGRASFDELIIRHVPRVEIATTAPGDTFIADADQTHPVELLLTVHDMTSAELSARLRVHDLAGNIMLEETMPVGRSTIRVRKKFDVDRLGFYSAEVEVREADQIIARRQRDFIVIPARSSRRPPTGLFGVSLEDEPLHRLPHDADLLMQLGLGTAIVPAWTEDLTLDGVDERYQALREIVEPMLLHGVEVIFALPTLPNELASELAFDRSQVLDGLARSEAWLPYLEPMLINLGERIHRWQIGRSGTTTGFWRDDLADTADRASAGFRRLVSRPVVLLPWSAEQATDASLPPMSGLSMRVPHQLPASSLGDFAQDWPLDEREMVVLVEPLPATQYAAASRLADASRRALELWRAGAPSMVLPSPWTNAEEERPDPILAVWSALGTLLENRVFDREVPYARGTTTWLLDGTADALPMLVAWREEANDASAAIHAKLADGPVTVIDVFGNRQSVPLVDNRHLIPLSELPVFIEGIDAELARFREGLAISPAIVPSLQKRHEHELVLHNPWPVMITGSVRVAEPDDWEYLPRRHSFAIAPDDEIRLPIALTFGRAELTGPKQIVLDLSLQADRPYRLDVAVEYEITMPNISASPLWRIVTTSDGQRDVLIDYYITNTGDRPVTLDAYLLAPNYPRERRIISGLAPGSTAIRSFYLADGLNRLAGEQVFLGAIEVEDGARLNQSISFPAASGDTVRTRTSVSSVPDR